jgi:hypothetical protein
MFESMKCSGASMRGCNDKYVDAVRDARGRLGAFGRSQENADREQAAYAVARPLTPTSVEK